MVDTERYDLVALAGTPGGIAAAVRAAREGLDTALVAFNAHLGGMMAGGLSVTDSTLGTDARSPLLDEFFGRVATHYREAYGQDSPQYEHCRDGFYFEPKVAEGVFDALVEEAGVDVYREYHPASVDRAERTLRAVRFEPFGGGSPIRLAADAFVEGSYEGDLAALAGVSYRVGRESRDEFGEGYAGRLFSEKGTRLFPGSTGAGDDAVQSYDYRLCLSSDPDNRRLPERPEGYDREEFLPMMENGDEEALGHGRAHRSERRECHLKSELVRPSRDEIEEMGLYSYLLLRGPLPNDKRDLNTADLPGAADDYPEADWERRREIEARHRDHVLGMLYFLQNDDAVPEGIREDARKWGLPRDEFEDTDGFPFQLYVREARRIEGRETFTEADARLAAGLDRAPVQEDSIAVAEYSMDSHDCRPVRRPGSLCDGHFFLGEITVPSQVPYGTLLPADLDNLLVPVPLSATHVGFGTIRLEPIWFQIGEAAGYAAALAAERGTAPGTLDATTLQRRLAGDGGMLSYFDDVDVGDDADWIAPVQYLGTKGFFGSYDARPEDALDRATAAAWARFAAELAADVGDPGARARSLPDPDGDPVTAEAFGDLLRAAFGRRDLAADGVDGALAGLEGELPRGAACRAIHDLLA